MRNIHKYTAALLSTVMILSLLLTGCSGRKDDGTVTITNVSYDPTREFYEKYNKIFESYYESEHSKKINVIQSHGGSGAQARSVVEGCNADVVTLALEHDIDLIYSNSLSVAISKSIEKPLNELKDRFITFAEGDIDSPLPTVESEDEIKELVSGVSAMSDRIRVIIKDSGRMLNEMSDGNFAIDTECEEVYTGAFTGLLTGIRKMNEEIDTTVRGVDDASGQVLTGSTNLAEAAQSLAEGATDQAASVEEMQATINELTSGIKTTAEELGTAYDEAYKYAEIAEGSRGDMEVLVQAMSRINETSEKIGAIITQIEDIASQTNLLSLNASIEAARAGEAGKGFAVVADQIRNLAEQSAKSAVDSKALIEAAIHEVGDGNMYAEKASTSLREVVDGIQAIADSAKKIKEISIEQADSMEQVEATAERIAEVVQNNSAAAQETSATSEELTAQATTLSGMVSVFKLRQ